MAAKKKRRGRPKGSKNKRKMLHPWDLSGISPSSYALPKRGRGRPKGSKGKRAGGKSGLVRAKAVYVTV